MSDITRTFFTTVAAVKLFDNSSDEIIMRDITIPGKLAAVDVKKHIDKNPDFVWYTLLKVLSVNYDEKLYSMSESDFILNGKSADERSKETRNTVSKTIVGFMALCKVADNESFEISDKALSLDRKMTAEAAKKWLNKRYSTFTVLKVSDVQEYNSLWYMSVADFMSKATVLPPRMKAEDK